MRISSELRGVALQAEGKTSTIEAPQSAPVLVEERPHYEVGASSRGKPRHFQKLNWVMLLRKI